MQAITYYIALPFIYLTSILPMTVLYGLSDLVVFPVLYHITGYRRKVVRENIRNSFPEKTEKERKAIEKKFYHYLSDLAVEILKGFTMTKQLISKSVTFESIAECEEFYREGRNIIFTLGHYGNYEWGAMAFPLQISHLVKIPFRQFSNLYMARLFMKSRSVFGAELFPTKDTYRQILEHHDKPFALCLANDQAAQPDKAYWTRFLHQDTSFFVGTEKIARQLNAAVIYATIHRKKRGHYHVVFETISTNPETEPEGFIMEKHASLLERDIRNKPEDWLWSHRRWKHKMPEGIDYGFNIVKKE